MRDAWLGADLPDPDTQLRHHFAPILPGLRRLINA
jgi:hypothetical protein